MFLNIEIERLRHQLTKAEMAEELCISPATLSDWVRGRKPIPSEGMRALLKLFNGTSLDYLLKVTTEGPRSYTNTVRKVQ